MSPQFYLFIDNIKDTLATALNLSHSLLEAIVCLLNVHRRIIGMDGALLQGLGLFSSPLVYVSTHTTNVVILWVNQCLIWARFDKSRAQTAAPLFLAATLFQYWVFRIDQVLISQFILHSRSNGSTSTHFNIISSWTKKHLRLTLEWQSEEWWMERCQPKRHIDNVWVLKVINGVLDSCETRTLWNLLLARFLSMPPPNNLVTQRAISRVQSSEWRMWAQTK